MAASKIWTYGDMSALGAEVGPGVDLTGYGIEALDVRSRPRKDARVGAVAPGRVVVRAPSQGGSG
jgi:hypothetical protein